MARTTVDIDDSVLREAKKLAKAQGKTLGEVVSHLIAAGLGSGTSAQAPAPFHWHSQDMGRPLVDIEDKESLQRVLDEP